MSIDVARLQARLSATKTAETKGEILIQLLHFWEDANWSGNLALARTILSSIDESVLSVELRCAMAYGLIKHKRMQDALPLLETAERQAADLEPSLLPEKTKAYIQYLLGRIFVLSGRLDAAIKILKEARSLLKSEDFSKQAYNTDFWFAMASLQKGDLLSAHRIAKSALNKYEGHLSNHRKSAFLNLLGIIAVHRKDYEHAVFYYDASYQVDPSQLDKKFAALNNIAGIFILEEKFEQAKIYLHHAIQTKHESLEEDLEIAWANLGNVFMGQRNYDRALLYFGYALERSTAAQNQHMSTEINIDMAYCMIQLKIWERAKEQLERALQLAKRHKVNRHLHRAYLLQLELELKKGDEISAMQAHQHCQEIISTDVDIAGQKLYLELLADNRNIRLAREISPQIIIDQIRLLIPKGPRKTIKLLAEQASTYFREIQEKKLCNWSMRTAHQAKADLDYLDSSAASWRVRDQIELHQLRKENARLRKDLQVKRRLADEWAHDLREPVNNIKGFSRLLLSNIDTEPQLEYSKYIHRAAEQLDEQLRGMAEYASTRSSEHKTEDVDLNDVLRVVHDNLQEHIRQEDALVLVQGLPQVQGYKPRLTRLFQNLLSNAIKFRHPLRQPEITVHWHVESEDYVFEVHDNGLGIPEQEQNRIFEPFERLEQEEEIPGSGIGLATCQRIVEAHGGKIWVQPKSGGGSIFSFTLPKNIKLGKNSRQRSANSGASS